MKKILSKIRQTIQKYNMICENDRIAVALSGGKDSFVLLEALCSLKLFYPINFEVGAIYIDIGFERNNTIEIVKYCKKHSINLHIEKSIIKSVTFDEMNLKNPCSLCSRMRRAALCDAAKRLDYNKIALGHNKDDAAETLILNLFSNGKIECFEPKTFYEDIETTIIRPLISTSESLILSYAKRSKLPVCEKICPVDGNTQRQKTKELIKKLSEDFPKLKDNIYRAIEKLEIFSSKERG